MKVEIFITLLKEIGIDTTIGVPDSTLNVLCSKITEDEYFNNYVTPNEGSAVGMAIGSYLATGKAACVYMQNSGIGNAMNPLTSLANEKVYGIPILFIVGWRGEGKKDEPQHVYMGQITEASMGLLGVEYGIVDSGLAEDEVRSLFEKAKEALDAGRQFAFLVKRESFEGTASSFANSYPLVREDAIEKIIDFIHEDDVIVTTTGKISREAYEALNRKRGQHNQQFLTVGGMGHASMIAHGIAIHTGKQVICLDGDGAALMHMGNMAFIAKQSPANLIHICLNNEAHESVGGMPTGAVGISYAQVAKACGYPQVCTAESMEELEQVLITVKETKQLTFLEIKVGMQSGADLGRPKESAKENKECFMEYHFRKG